MNHLAALIYGVIQGVTEFLPVSSSAHLAILPQFLSIEDPGILFDLSMHMGTALSIILYFHKDIMKILKSILFLLRERKIESVDHAFTFNMMIATMTTFLIALLLKKTAMSYGRTPLMIALNLVFFGFLMFIADQFFKYKERAGVMNTLNYKVSIFIGFFQALAIFPGVSRSGSTLTISRFMGLSRSEGARFSFLLSLPIIIAGFILKVPDFFGEGLSFSPLICFYGSFISFIVGLMTIHFFLKFIKRVGLVPFAFYRLLLGFVIYWVLIKS